MSHFFTLAQAEIANVNFENTKNEEKFRFQIPVALKSSSEK